MLKHRPAPAPTHPPTPQPALRSAASRRGARARTRTRTRRVFPLLTVLVVTLTMSACTLPIDNDVTATTTRTTSDDLRPGPGPGMATASDTSPASGTSVATVDTALRDADAGWQHGAPVVGGMTTASDGTILLAGSLHARVLAFAPDGGALPAYIVADTGSGVPTPWQGSSADVSAGPNGSVAFLNSEAQRITVFSAPDTVALDLPLTTDSSPKALAIGGDGRLYVAENLPDATSRIAVFTADGTQEATWTQIDGAPFPIAIRDLVLTAAGDGLLVLTDDWQGQPAVLRLTLDGTQAAPPLLLDAANSHGLRPATVSAMPDGGLVVADPAWRMLVVYGADGTLLRRIPLAPDPRGEMREISIATLPDGRVVSADGQTGTLLVHPLSRVSVDGPALQTTVSHLPCDRIVRVVGVGFRPGESLVRSTIRVGETVLESSALAPVAPDGSLALVLDPQRWATTCLEQEFVPSGNPLDIRALAGSVTVTTQAVLFPSSPPPVLTLLLPEEPLTCTSRITITGEGFAPDSEVVIEQIDPVTKQVTLTVDGTLADAEGTFSAALTPARVAGCAGAEPAAGDATATITLRAATQRSSGLSYPAASLNIPLGGSPTPTP